MQSKESQCTEKRNLGSGALGNYKGLSSNIQLGQK